MLLTGPSLLFLLPFVAAFEINKELFQHERNVNVSCSDSGGVCTLGESTRCPTVQGECARNYVCCDTCSSSTKRGCSRKGGTCKQSCEIGDYRVKNGCRRSDCKCCVQCSIKQRCVARGGFCFSRQRDCPNGTIDKKGCRGKKCKCCIPEPTTATTTTPTTPTTPTTTTTTTTTITAINPVPSCEAQTNFSEDFNTVSVPSNGDSMYQNDVSCEWNIQVRPGYALAFTILSMDIEGPYPGCPYDSLSFIDVPSLTELNGGKVCGNASNVTFVSRTNSVRIRFQTDGSVVGSGFTLYYRAFIQATLPPATFMMNTTIFPTTSAEPSCLPLT
ncbi:hypothetical protein SK128_013290, partial [Halocaridina rubra]